MENETREVMIQNAVYDVANDIWYNSSHTHDYVSIPYNDGHLFIDGGTSYRRTNANFSELEGFEEWSLYESDSFEDIKKKLLWGTYGKDGKSPLRWQPFSVCSTEHLWAILETQPIDYLREIVIKSILADRENNE